MSSTLFSAFFFPLLLSIFFASHFSFLFIHSYIRPMSIRYPFLFILLTNEILYSYMNDTKRQNETKRIKRNQEKREHRTGHDKPSILFHHHYHQFILFVVVCIFRIWIPWVCFVVTVDGAAGVVISENKNETKKEIKVEPEKEHRMNSFFFTTNHF